MNAPKSAARDARLDLRLSREHKRMVEQAATVTGQSLSDFAISQLVRAAQEAIDQAAVARLSMRDWSAFLKLIESDARPNKALRTAAARYKRRRA